MVIFSLSMFLFLNQERFSSGCYVLKCGSSMFLKLLKICTAASVTETPSSHGYLSITFPKIFLWLLPNIEQKRIFFLNNSIVWCKNHRAMKDLSGSGSFVIQCLHFFIFPTRTFYVFLKNISRKKKSIKLEGLLCKGKSSQKFRKCSS